MIGCDNTDVSFGLWPPFSVSHGFYEVMFEFKSRWDKQYIKDTDAALCSSFVDK